MFNEEHKKLQAQVQCEAEGCCEGCRQWCLAGVDPSDDTMILQFQTLELSRQLDSFEAIF